MSAVIHREAVVGPDGVIAIPTPELQPGQRVAITIEPEQTSPQQPSSRIRDILAEAPGHLEFQTADEVDAYIREERDAWDR